MKLNQLTEEEKRIIKDKGTEAPFSGEYEKFNEEGLYVCRQCEAPLYRSDDKFDANCGWPSFDSEVGGAVKRTLDKDGVRTEITCARCEAHLGHVFEGENLTPKNVRHCVNSISMKFVPKSSLGLKEKIYFGGGCFWCVEGAFNIIKGVTSVVSGYAGGEKENPTYEEVSSGNTGHAEVVEVTFDSSIVSLELLLSVFFTAHDPTTLNRQGGDIGTQYRSIIICTSEDQKEIVHKFIDILETEKYFENKIVTEVVGFDKFYPAESYHANYYEKNKEAPYCELVISPKIEKLRQKFKSFLRDDYKN